MRSLRNAFSLLELVITLVVLALLTAIAIPSYQNIVSSVHTTVAQTAALDDANTALATMPQGYTTPSAATYEALVGAANPNLISVTDNGNGTANFVILVNGSNQTICVTIPPTRADQPQICSSSTTSTTTTTIPISGTTTTSSPLTVPDAPTALAAVASDASATATWSAPTNTGGSALTGYSLQYSSDDGSTWHTVTSCSTLATSCTIPGLANGVTYLVRVAAQNAQGTSAYTSTISVTPLLGGPGTPTPPTAIVVSYTSGTTSALVSWTIPTSDGYGHTNARDITSYSVTGAPGGTCVSSATSAPLAHCTVTGLVGGTSYTFTVTATNAASIVSASSSASTAIDVVTPPSAPTVVIASYTPGSTSATISWTAPSNDGYGHTDGSSIASYAVTSSGVSPRTCSVTGSPPATTCVVTGLTPGTSYTFTVTATNTGGFTSPASTPSSPTGIVTVAPTAPTAVTVAYTSGTTSATISWTTPSNDGTGDSSGTDITSYAVTGSLGGTCTSSSLSAPATSCTVTGLTPGGVYTFSVTATNAASLTSPSSAPSASITVVTVPTPPLSPVVVYVPGTTTAAISWTAPSNDGYGTSSGTHITSYTVTGTPGGSCTSSASSSPATTCTISGLTPGTTYTFTITATNSVGTSAPSTATTAIGVVTAPGTPTSVSGISNEDGQSPISWTAPTSNGGSPITGYTVQYAVSPYTTWTTATTTSSSSPYTVTGLSNGTTYKFEVAATNSAGTGSFSAPSAGVVTSADPNAPTGVTATYTPGSTSASISWTAPNNNGATITSYNVTGTPGGSCASTGSPAATTCTVSGLTIGNSYTFIVTATNASGTGPASTPSNSTGVITILSTAPSSPSVSYTPGATSATISWTAPSNDGTGTSIGTGITSYTVTGAPAGSCTSTASSAPPTSCVVAGLVGGTSYTFSVTATNIAGTSPASSSTSSINVVTVPGAPTAVTGTSNADSQSSVSWTTPSSTGGATITSYTIRYATSPYTTWTTATTSPSSSPYVVTGLTNGTAYEFEVAATNSAGTGAFSSPSSPATPATTPCAPTAVSGTANANAQSSISFTPACSGGSTITSYTIRYATSPYTTWTTATTSASSSPYVVTGLTNGTAYEFEVAATNALGTGSFSSPSSPVTPSTVPCAPTSTTGTSNEDSQSTVSFTPGCTGGATITSYTIQYATSPYTTWTTATTSASSSPYVVTGLTNGTAYEFEVAATNISGTSSLSSPSSPATPAALPGAPTSVAGTSNANTQSSVSWTTPSSGGSAITSYVVKYAVSPYTSWTTATVSASSSPYVVTGLTNGTAYEFEVAATNAVGTGPLSAPSAPVTPSTVPCAVSTVTPAAAQNAQSSVAFTPGCTGGSAITSYTIQYAVSPYTTWTTATTSASSSPYVVTGLTNGTAYEFEVAATNASGTGSFSSPAGPITPSTVPSAPTLVTATYPPGTTSASISWTAPSNNGATITSYTVTGVPGGTCSSTGSPAPTTCTVTGLTPGNSYTFTVTATNASGTGPASAASNSTGIVTILPTAPLSPSASYTAGATSALISWTAPSNDGTGSSTGTAITAYTVTGSPSGTCTSTASSSPTTSCTVTGLTPGTSYTFSITATNPVGTGPSSSTTTSFTVSTVPCAPTAVSAVGAQNAQSSVSFTPGCSGGSTITSYTVQYASSPYTSWSTATTSATSSPYVVSGLTNGTTYEFQVASTNAVGTGAFSSPSSPITPSTVPCAPTSVAGTSNANTQSSVSWTSGCTGGASITSYTVQYAVSPYSTWATATTSASASPYLVTGLTNGTAYEFQVSATNVSGTGAYSAPSAPATPATLPGTPTGVAGTSNANTQSSVSWTAPSSGGSAITSYTVQYAVSPYTSWSTATTSAASSPYVVTGLTNGTTYEFEVAATNAIGTGSYSTPSSPVTPSTVPCVPTSVAGTSNANTQSSVSWTAGCTGGASITSYTVQYAVSPYTSWTTATIAATSSPYLVTGLTNGTAYEFEVAATNASGTGAFSAPSSTSTPATTPSAPTAVAGTSGSTSQSSVSWTTPATGGTAITSYTVQYAVSPYSTWTTATTSASSSPYVVTGLANGVAYEFEVAATNAVGTGPFSAPSASATTATIPCAPTSVVGAAAQNAQSSVSFTPGCTGGSPITSYTVQYAVSPYSTWTTATTSASSSPYVVTGLTNGTAYEFQASATNALGTGSYSAPSSPITPSTVPGAPTGVTAPYTVGTTSDVISWTAPANNGATITSYTVTGSPGGSCTSTGSPAAPTCTVTGLTPGNSYTFTVTATNVSGTGPASSPSSSTGVITILPSAPLSPSVGYTAGNTTALVSWSVPSNDGQGGGAASAITSYTVTGSPNGTCTSSSSSAPTTSCTVTGLVGGTSYTFSVTATNGVGSGPTSTSTSSINVTTVPGAPTTITATPVMGIAYGATPNMTVGWTTPASNGGSAITSYTVQYSVSPYTSWTTATTSASGSSYVVATGLTAGTTYEFQVAATNLYGSSTPGVGGSTTTAATAPGTPTVSGATAGNASIVATASDTLTGGSAVTGYTITANPGSFSCTTSSTSCTITGLTNGTPYSLSTTATNAIGTSGTSLAEDAAISALTPVAYYKLNTTSGTTATDSSTGANTATYGAGSLNPAWTIAGSASMNSTSLADPNPSATVPSVLGDYMTIDTGLTPTHISLDMWTQTLGDFFFGSNSSGYGCMVRQGGAGWLSGLAIANNWTSWPGPASGTTLTNQVWEHIDLVLSGGTVTLSINGTVITSGFGCAPQGTYLGLIGDQAGSGYSAFTNLTVNGTVIPMGGYLLNQPGPVAVTSADSSTYFAGGQASATSGLTSTTAFTASIWAKTSIYGTNAAAVGFDVPASWAANLFLLYIGESSQSGGARVYWANTSYPLTSINMNGTTWHHYAITVSATTMTLYIDGVSIATQTVPVYSFTPTSLSLGAGNNNGSFQQQYVGNLAEAAFYNYALSPTQINSIYTAGSVTPYVPTPPATPSAPTATSYNNTSVPVSWTAPSTSGSAISSYQLRYSTDSSFATGVTTLSPGNVLSTTVSGLTNGTTYYFEVAATNSSGTSSWSSSSSAIPSTAPSMPTITSSANVAGQPDGSPEITTYFNPPASSGGLSYTYSFAVSASTGAPTTYVGGGIASSPLTFGAALAAGNTYYVSVAACNTAGQCSAWNPQNVPVFVATAPAAPVPAYLNVVTGIGYGSNGQLSVGFSAGDSGGSAISSYGVEESTGGAWTVVSYSVGGSPFNFGATPGLATYVAMEACNAYGCSPFTGGWGPATPATIPQVAPITISGGYAGTSILVSNMESGANGGSALTTYVLYRRSATVTSCATSCAWGAYVAHASGAIAVNYTDTGLATTSEYSYGIVVSNAMGSTIENNVGGSLRG